MQEIFDTCRRIAARGLGCGKAQDVFEAIGPARHTFAVAQSHWNFTGNDSGGVAAQLTGMHAVAFEYVCRQIDARQGMQQMFEAHFAGLVSESDIEGMVGTCEHYVIDPDGPGARNGLAWCGTKCGPGTRCVCSRPAGSLRGGR